MATVEPITPVEASDRRALAGLRSEYFMFVGGQWVEAASGERMEIVDPSTEGLLAVGPAAGAEDVDRRPRRPVRPGCLGGDRLAAPVRGALGDGGPGRGPRGGARCHRRRRRRHPRRRHAQGREQQHRLSPLLRRGCVRAQGSDHRGAGGFDEPDRPRALGGGRQDRPLQPSTPVLCGGHRRPARRGQRGGAEAFGAHPVVRIALCRAGRRPGAARRAEHPDRWRRAGSAIVRHPEVPRIAFTGSVGSGRAVLRDAAEHIKVVWSPWSWAARTP